MPGVFLILMVLSDTAGDVALDRRVMALAQQLRCLVCQNETLADSQADLAADLRQQIRERMKAGNSEAEITSFLTDRYGDFVLYRPRVTPQTYLLWFGPFALLALGLIALARFLKRWPSLQVKSMSADDRRRARELLLRGSDPSLTVYRDQLDEIESDLRKGTLSREQFERDREELDRRLLEDCRDAR